MRGGRAGPVPAPRRRCSFRTAPPYALLVLLGVHITGPGASAPNRTPFSCCWAFASPGRVPPHPLCRRPGRLTFLVGPGLLHLRPVIAQRASAPPDALHQLPGCAFAHAGGNDAP